MKFNTKHIIRGLLCASVTLLAGCISDYDECQPTTSVADAEVSLSIRMLVPNASPNTRAAGHEEEFGNAAESYIDIDGGDFHVLVFDAKSGWQMLELDATSIKEKEKKLVEGSDNLYEYILTTENINNKWAGLDLVEEIRVMVLANWKSFDASSSYSFANTCINKDIATNNIFLNGTDYNFTMPNSNLSPWMPTDPKTTGSVQNFIPMFGISEPVAVNLNENGKTTEIRTTDISMMRSIAKVEIVDNTDKGKGIERVLLSMSNNEGRFIPNLIDNSDWNETDPQTGFFKQVKSPSIPASVTTLTNLPLKQITNNDQKIWTAYIPEMDLTTLRPQFLITVDGSPKSMDFDNYKDGKVVTTDGDHLDAVLRNHIYRYEVKASLSNLTVSMEVLPWDMEQDEDVHFDLPAVRTSDAENPGPFYLQWTTKKEDPDNPGDYIYNGYVDDAYNMQLLMKPGTDDYAECTFTLAAPLNATWIAQLVPLQGKLDAFELHPNFSIGKIDGTTPAIVKIRNTAETVNDERNEARLVIMVEYPDKTQKEAIVVNPANEKGLTNYTIVQQKTSIE